jgi:thioredoxin-like negative regulator of GroEL
MSENIKHVSDATFEKDALIKHVSDATFEQDVLQSATPVLVDYGAEWRGPCGVDRAGAADMAKEYAGRLTCQARIDANPRSPASSAFAASDADPFRRQTTEGWRAVKSQLAAG